VLDAAASEQRRDLLSDLDDLLASERLGKVKLDLLLLEDRKHESHSEGIGAAVAGRLSPGAEIPEVFLQQDGGKR